MMKFVPFTTVLLVLVGCGQEPPTDGPEAWKKAPESDKLARIMTMPLSPEMKITGINNLKISDAEKQKAIAEVRASASSSQTTRPGQPGSP